MEKINCLIIDDEPIARQGIREYVTQVDFLNPVGECKNAMEATTFLQTGQVKLMFLDIQMPKVSGIEFFKNLRNPPMTIFTTAFQQYAIESYELDIIDYLLKPIRFPRFYKAVLKAQEYHLSKNQDTAQNKSGFFFVKCSQKIEKIQFKDVLYIEGLSNYIVIHTKEKKYVTYLTVKSIEEQLPDNQFIRIHRSYLISLPAIKTIDGSDVVIGNTILPISKNFKDEVMSHIQQYLFRR